MLTTLLIVAYLLGSVNSALIICKLMRLPSPRTEGSGNPGTTNVLRIGGKKAAAFTLIGDILKAIIPISIGHYFHLPYMALSWTLFAAVLGHIYPIFFGFKGGKGVATTIGGSFAINPFLGAIILLTWLIMAITFRYSSLASLTSLILSPFYASVVLGGLTSIPFGLLALLIIFTHQQNIKRLIAGNENKIGKKKS